MGTVPGVIVGAIVRVEFLPGDRAFAVVVAAVLIPLGVWILIGCVGGIYGIGGSILAPVLVGSGRSPAEVAPATLASTFVTSIAGVVTFVAWLAPG